MPGCACTSDRASAARVPLPLGRPPRALGRPGGRPGFLRVALAGALAGVVAAAAVAAAVVALLALVAEPRGRPGRRRRRWWRGRPVTIAVAVETASDATDPSASSSADAAAFNRSYSCAKGSTPSAVSKISWRFSSRKSATMHILPTCRVTGEGRYTACGRYGRQRWNPGPGGSNIVRSMRPSGLEPPRAVKLTRPSTLRVYQIPPRAQNGRV